MLSPNEAALEIVGEVRVEDADYSEPGFEIFAVWKDVHGTLYWSLECGDYGIGQPEISNMYGPHRCNLVEAQRELARWIQEDVQDAHLPVPVENLEDLKRKLFSLGLAL